MKNYENLSILKIKKTSKSLNKLEKSLWFKKFLGNIDSVNYEETLTIMIIIMVFLMNMNIEKLEV